jgi:hypothetical protein
MPGRDDMKFDLTIPETNLVLSALSNLPYGQVADLIAKIRQQAQDQMKETDHG